MGSISTLEFEKRNDFIWKTLAAWELWMTLKESAEVGGPTLWYQ